MAKKKKRSKPFATQPTSAVKTPAEAETAKKAESLSAAQQSRRGGRETVDALAVAFVLAFLIRTFVAEMFVIPTGSMAPTLMGRHKDVFCEECGTRFRINSSDDTEDYLPQLQREVALGRITRADMMRRLAGLRCIGGQCPQCNHIMLVDDPGVERFKVGREDEGDQDANFSGDRLLVSKYAYSFEDPDRWDVAVFKYPGNSQTNYIKRVVGLPGERLRIFDGDLWVKEPDGAEPYTIARKPPEVVEAMSQLVHDTHHEPQTLVDAGVPIPWSGDGWSLDLGGVHTSHGAAVYRPEFSAAADDQTRWLRYRHAPPNEALWDVIRSGDGPAGVSLAPERRLITDHTPYNTQLKLRQALALDAVSLQPLRAEDLGRVGVHWVGDLILEADFSTESGAGEASLELVEAGDHYGVTFDLATGEAQFWRRAFETDTKETLATATTAVRGAGAHSVRLANVDNRMLLWVNGALIETEVPYERDSDAPATVPRSSATDEGDLAPAGIGARNASLRVERLRLLRDGYYIAIRWDDRGREAQSDITSRSLARLGRPDLREAMVDLAADRELWPAFAERLRADFTIDDGQLFVMGDNSGWSLDARLWAGGNGPSGGRPGGPYLERTQLVGKAICVYWPHAWYSVPFTRRFVPAWPNFEDMRLVR